MNQQTLLESITQVLKLADEDLSLLLTCVASRNLKKGELLLKEGEVCSAFYLVNYGYLRTWFNKDGTAINMNFTFEGKFTTNLKSYKNREPSTLMIEAGEDTLVWVFNVKVMPEPLRKRPDIARFIRHLAIQLLLDAEEYSNLFKIQTPTERYRYIEKNNPQLLQRVSLSQMASYLGVARETLSRIRGKK